MALVHSNISQTSTYLESTLKGQHEAMRRFDEQRELACNAGATEDGKRTHDRRRSADQENTNPQQTVN